MTEKSHAYELSALFQRQAEIFESMADQPTSDDQRDQMDWMVSRLTLLNLSNLYGDVSVLTSLVQHLAGQLANSDVSEKEKTAYKQIAQAAGERRDQLNLMVESTRTFTTEVRGFDGADGKDWAVYEDEGGNEEPPTDNE